MSKGRRNKNHFQRAKPKKVITPPPVKSLLDIMEDGREFESLIKVKAADIDIIGELRKGLKEISDIRGRETVCYLSNVVNPMIRASKSIDYSDDLPFSELLSSVPDDVKELDIILVTPGGSGTQTSKFVDRLRPRFENVAFILPNIAMSAGTIFVMSGDEIIMDSRAYIGPIDPQVRNKDGMFVPAQSILTLINEIQGRGDELIKKGQNPQWTDLQIMRQIDPKEIGNAVNASKYSIEMVENYLYNFKFKTWTHHSTDGSEVTDGQKRKRAKEIAELLCDHSQWKSHGRGIPREAAWDVCKLRITHPESIDGLERAIRRFWAIVYWAFENSTLFKVFLSQNYCIVRSENIKINNDK